MNNININKYIQELKLVVDKCSLKTGCATKIQYSNFLKDFVIYPKVY